LKTGVAVARVGRIDRRLLTQETDEMVVLVWAGE
jgi:hypothetical protein